MNSTVDVSLVKDEARRNLMSLIQSVNGDKGIVWDRALANPVNLIVRNSELTKNGMKMSMPLERGTISSSVETPESIIFMCRPKISVMANVVSCIRNEEKTSRRKRKFYLIFIPYICQLCIQYLEEKGIEKSFEWIKKAPLLLYPLDKDVLTMEMDGLFEEYRIQEETTSLFYVAKALLNFQKHFGTPSRIFGRGFAADKVLQLMKNEKQSRIQPSACDFEYMILIDRAVDPLSPLLTQLTYEGLIDELYRINNNQVKFPEEKLGDNVPIHLNSDDSLFKELRDKSFSAIGGILRSKTAEIQEFFKQKDKAQSMGEMKRLVEQIPAINALKQSLSIHTSIAELLKSKTENVDFLESLECEQELLNGLDTDKINGHIEQLCIKKKPLNRVLRLIIVQCVTSGGLKPKLIDHYKRLLIHNYGFQHMLTIQRLCDVGLLKVIGGSRYSSLSRTFNLTATDISETKPNDFAYVHCIYAPLSIRLVQYRLKSSLWTASKDAQSLIAGPIIDEADDSLLNEASMSTVKPIISRGKRRPKFCVVAFIGGCTYAEISALRFLANQDDERDYLVITTKVINGNTFLESLYDPLSKLEL